MQSSSSQGSPELSSRGQRRFNDLRSSAQRHWIQGKFFDKEHNPEGTISLATAENSLMSDELLQYMNSHFELKSAHLKYRSSIINGFVSSTIDALPLYVNEYARPIVSVTPRHTIPGPGLGALFSHFMWAVCNEGDGVLMVTPYYADYVRDIVYPAKARPVAAHIPPNVNPLGIESIPYLRSAIEQSHKASTRIRALILCNPHNPLGNAYPVDTILAYCAIAEEFNLHLLVDEVYANQVFKSSLVPEPTAFVSILSLDVALLANCNPSRIHVLAGPTKDFGASGVKVGAFVSQHNPDLIKIIEAALGPIPISSAADALFTQIINDREFRLWFLEENRKRLTAAFGRITSWCSFHNIPFVPVSAGVFVLVDFAPLIDRVSERGASVNDKIDVGIGALLKNGIFMRPGTVSEDPIPTRFRMTFTLPEDVMLIALRRIERTFSLLPWPGKPETGGS